MAVKQYRISRDPSASGKLFWKVSEITGTVTEPHFTLVQKKMRTFEEAVALVPVPGPGKSVTIYVDNNE